jgi:putative acetyltransferase
MRIRAYTPADRAAVVQLVERVLTEYGFPFAQVGSLERDLDAIAERYKGAGGFWVAEIDHGIGGTIAVRPKEGRTCEIKRLYLRSDLRGRGLGQALYEHAEAFVRACGYDCIWLDSSRRFEKAHRLYERNGFSLVEYVDNEWQDAVYEKRLAAPSAV